MSSFILFLYLEEHTKKRRTVRVEGRKERVLGEGDLNMSVKNRYRGKAEKKTLRNKLPKHKAYNRKKTVLSQL